MKHLLKFEKVVPTLSQINDLYLLLKKRSHAISHSALPTQNEHCKFVSENPYLEWYLIYKSKELIGSVYLQSDNSIGLNIIESTKQNISEIISFIRAHHNPLPSIKSVRREEFYVNVASDNEELIKILQQLGKGEIQRSFVI